MDSESLQLLEDGLRKTMTTASGQQLDAALAELGWLEMLDEMPHAAVPLVFRLLGETGAHAPVLNDVVLRAAGREGGGTVPMRYTGGSWVVWARTGEPSSVLGGDLPIHPVPEGDSAPVAAGRHALGWWLVGAGRAMLSLARQHALDRSQFGRPVASFQAIRHRLAETLVAIEGAEATLLAAAAEPDELSFLLAKAAAGGIVRYGLYRQDAAMMTCFTPSVMRADHVHFIDGARGGYASAATALKAMAA